MIYCVVVWINYFKNYRSQKTCQLQKDSGLYSSLRGLSLQGLSPGPVLGFSVNPRTVQNMKTDMAKTHNDHVIKQLQQVNAVCTYTRHNIDINTCTDVSAELPASIIREQTPSASLPYYLNQAQNCTIKTACIFIINDKTVAFIPTQNGITVFDSHYHGTSGAFVAMAPSDAAFELLSWFKTINSIPHNLGTVTCVSFR